MEPPPSDFKVPTSKPRIPEDAQPHFLQAQPPESPPSLSQPTSSYIEPAWACKPDEEFSFEVLKNGQIIETFSKLETKSHWSFGRLPNCNDIVLAHPTISRFHAVLQYRGEVPDTDTSHDNPDTPKTNKPGPGWYLYDLGSTHGTYVNKQRCPVKTYIRLRVGYMLKMGASTRSFILLGPNHDEEEVKAESITEMKEQKQKAIEEVLLKQEQQRQEEEEKARLKEAEGVSWGMAEDADDEPDLSVNPFAVSTNEELFLDDPKKTLRGFFEREGLDLEYKTEDLPNQTFLCKVELPVEDENGRAIVAQVTHKGKKKDCVAQCALEACRILDRHGVLRKANQEAAVRRKKADSDSDNDDDFLDRTGDIEKRRKRKAQSQESTVLTYEELMRQEKELQEKIVQIEERIAVGKRGNKKATAGDAEDDLDAFMSNLEKGASEKTVDKVEIKKWRLEEQALQKNLRQVQRLIEVTRPLELPKIRKVGDEGEEKEELGSKSGQDKEDKIPLFGKKMKLEVIRTGKDEEARKEQRDNSIETVNLEERMDIQERVKNDNVTPMDPPKVIPMDKKQEKSTQPEKDQEKDSHKDVRKPPVPVSSPVISAEDQAEAQEKKKARQRVRNRKQVRDNVDMEETVEEAEEKFTDWLPPSNQSGDGTTALNDKLGY